MSKNRWSSQLSFIVATVGAAVGLGNIWKFPYTAGTNGGGAFIFLYLVFLFCIGVPALLGEMLLGRMGRKNPINTLQDLSSQYRKSRYWGLAGIWGALALIFILSFYSVVSGWSIAYIVRSINGSLSNISPSEINALWSDFIQDPLELLFWHGIFMILTIVIVIQGIKNGIEKASNILMPALFLILIALVVYNYNTAGLDDASKFLFSFKFSEITSNVIIEALGQAFFSLALGAGAMLVYGSYVKREQNLNYAVITIALLNTFIACLAGLAIFPIIFKNGLSPDAGPNLMFNTLPIIFAELSYGKVLSCAFFFLLLFAALTSSISMLEPLVAILVERTKLKRKNAAFIIGGFAWILGILSIFSFNIWENIKLFNKWSIFDLVTGIPTNIILPIGGLLFSIFVGWCIPKVKIKEASNFSSSFLFNCFYISLKWIVPLAIVSIFISLLL